MPTAENFAQLIPSATDLTEEQRSAVLEIAVMAAAVDRAIHRDEVASLQRLAARLGLTADAQIAALFDRFRAKTDEETATKRLRAAAVRLETATAREIAYKAACAITLADLVLDERESAFTQKLAETLALSEEVTSRLADEVSAAMKAD